MTGSFFGVPLAWILIFWVPVLGHDLRLGKRAVPAISTKFPEL